jgi:2-aminoethylphosphonate transport system permease protein
MKMDKAVTASPGGTNLLAASVRNLWIAPPVLILAGLFFYPLSLIVIQALGGDESFFSLETFGQVLRSPLFLNGLSHTIQIAVLATLGCLILGFILSLVIAFVPFPGARLIGRLIDTFISLPTFLIALAFTFVYGSAGLINQSLMELLRLELPPLNFLYSQWGVILSEITVYTPFVMRPLLASFSQLDNAQIEVASSLGARPLRIVGQIILPAALPALLAGGSLCLLLTVNEFGIVLFIGAKDVITLPLLIYGKAIQEFDYTTACVIAVVNIALSLFLYACYRSIVTFFGGSRATVV